MAVCLHPADTARSQFDPTVMYNTQCEITTMCERLREMLQHSLDPDCSEHELAPTQIKEEVNADALQGQRILQDPSHGDIAGTGAFNVEQRHSHA